MVEAKKLRVYCETSFWSYLTVRPTKDEKVARDQALTLKWWDEIAPFCDIYISQHVQMESADGGPQFAVRRLDAMQGSFSLDGYVSEVRELSRALLVAHAVPQTEPTDAMHIATAAFYRMDVLLTWNCKHMANPVALPKTISTILKVGYECPIIITPADFLMRKEEFGL